MKSSTRKLQLGNRFDFVIFKKKKMKIIFTRRKNNLSAFFLLDKYDEKIGWVRL